MPEGCRKIQGTGDGKVVECYFGEMMPCEGGCNKVYSGEHFLSNPPKWMWICSECTAYGDDMAETCPEKTDWKKYWEIMERAGFVSSAMAEKIKNRWSERRA